MPRLSRFVYCICTGAAFATLCFGQPAAAESATVLGVTLGPGGTPLAGVQVIVKSLDDGQSRQTASDEAGAFRALDLKPGKYLLAASKDGFVSPPESTIELAANQSCRT